MLTQSRARGVCPSGRRAAPAAEPLGAWHVWACRDGDAADPSRCLTGSGRARGGRAASTRIR